MKRVSVSDRELPLRYGVNPHQAPARAYVREGRLPLAVRSGAPSYVNVLDALSAWQLVRELSAALLLPAAASFKHVSPAGAAVAVPLTDEDRAVALVPPRVALTPLATAYARARGADRLASFGDVCALSAPCDEATAALIAQEVSDGIVAPGYDDAALAILREKRGGRYLVLEVDPSYDPPALETREVFGVTLEQRRNDLRLGREHLSNVVTKAKALPEDAVRDLLVALVTLKYTQSNSVALAKDGQAIGVGAGQQARVDCVRLASDKADTWWLRRHPKVLALRFPKGTKRPDRDNAVDAFIRDELSADEKREWVAVLRDVSLGSDAFFPFRDSIDRAARSGVRYVAQPGGSQRDREVVAAADEYGMAMAFTGVRLFHH